jgi:hypothetical protein
MQNTTITNPRFPRHARAASPASSANLHSAGLNLQTRLSRQSSPEKVAQTKYLIPKLHKVTLTKITRTTIRSVFFIALIHVTASVNMAVPYHSKLLLYSTPFFHPPRYISMQSSIELWLSTAFPPRPLRLLRVLCVLLPPHLAPLTFPVKNSPILY